MSNGLLSSGGFSGWDTTPIQNNSNNSNNSTVSVNDLFDNDTNNNNNSKLKPYKNERGSAATDYNPFQSQQPLQPQQEEHEVDNEYVNPFSFDFGVDDADKIKPAINPMDEFDLLFDKNIPLKDNHNMETMDDAFFKFDFGATAAGDKIEENKKKLEIANESDVEEHTSASSASSASASASSSSSSSSSSTYQNHQNENEEAIQAKKKANYDDLKISPPTKQSTRKKKRRIATANKQNISQNQRAFESLHNKFDPTLIGNVPISQINSKQKQKQKEPHFKKRHTEPVNIHSERQKQLKAEGLIANKEKDKEQSERKEKEKEKKYSYYNVLPELHRGTALLKYGRRGYPHFRQFNLTSDNEHLRWFSSKKKLQQSSINVGVINEILTGQHTKEFRRIAWTTLTPASFSIIYDNKKKSLNLVAKSVDEMKMWVQALRKLRDLKKKGQLLYKMDKLQVEVDFRDRNRPQSRNHSGNFLRSHETKERQVDPILQRKLIDDIAALRKQFIEISREANNPIVQSTKEYESIEQILSELEERIEELDHEVRNTRNTKIAENDVWRTRIDLESLREKIKVINKQHKSQYKNSKRRWSVF